MKDGPPDHKFHAFEVLQQFLCLWILLKNSVHCSKLIENIGYTS